MTRQLHVFLSYASEDNDAASQLYKRLASQGFIDVWFDKEKLLPGENWKYEIEKASNRADVVLICLSSRSLRKEGFVQREIHHFLDRAKEKPEGTIFLIPVKLEPCETPRHLSQWHWAEIFNEADYQRLLKSLRRRAQDLGIAIEPSATQPEKTKESILTPLDKTMSNPRYESDTKCLESNDYKISSVINLETVLVIVGCWIPAELCDRPVAEVIRDEIDKRGKKDRYRRALVLSDTEWLRNKGLQQCPVISIGGPPANAVTKQFEATAPAKYRWDSGQMSRVSVPGSTPRVALWGVAASDTSKCVELFIHEPEGLTYFLAKCWK